MLLALGMAFYVVRVYKKVGLVPSVAWAFAGYGGLWVSSWFVNYHMYMKGNEYIIISHYAAIAIVNLVLLTEILFSIKRHHLTIIDTFIAFLCAADTVYVLGQWAYGNHYMWRGGFFANGSLNGTFIAVTYPFLIDWVWKRYRWEIALPILSLPIVAILCSITSVPVGVMAVALATYSFCKIKNMKLKIAIPIVSFSLMIFAGWIYSEYFSPGNEATVLFSSSGRFKLYIIAFDTWLHKGNIWYGYGTSTYPFFGILGQVRHKYMLNEWNVWLHSDILQMLLENGITGFLAYLTLGIVTMWKLRHNAVYFTAFMAFVSSMFFSYTLHYHLPALFGGYLIYVAFGGPNKKEGCKCNEKPEKDLKDLLFFLPKRFIR